MMHAEYTAAEDAVLMARVSEAVRNAEHRAKIGFVGFLDERQAALAKCAVPAGVPSLLWGGDSECERVLLGVFPNWQEPEASLFPLTALTFHFRKEAAIGHRDVLGSLMGLGVERDTVGDILIEPGRAVVFVRTEMAPYFSSQLTKIGREGIQITEGAETPLPKGAALLPISGTVASERLDCVVAALANLSRSEAAERITAGLVTHNFLVCTSVSDTVRENDKITVRGAGKYKILQIGPLTRKQRLSFRAGKYQ